MVEKFNDYLIIHYPKNRYTNIQKRIINKIYHNRYDNSYLIYIINYKDNKKYCHGFSIHEKWLDEECINDIVNRLLIQ